MRRLLHDRTAATAIEFALAAPVLLILVTGGLELGYDAYVRTVVEGEMQRASRSRTLETAGDAAQRAFIENRVRDTVHQLAPTASVTFTRRSFRDYAEVDAPFEPFNDVNANGVCDAHETYQDLNNNGRWDERGGNDESDGNARDVVVYTATVHHARLMPIAINPLRRERPIVARTAFRNQPYDQQTAVIERSCP
ncbi:TadE/TadG family type IV pilus assembly protein [Sphingomonas sp. BK345]|uniref:TadE/TadG family type IV pilus assembly protein n=1 Tax=Sphingomonas sp. BK345 TaxID=2586980 RepID=UPI0016224146|nr:TadE/TadG family type IV pilus assembly protein [Sphingomonas sp. BK345]MBB3475365.1 Flp pilus assembly pilin Flp [Sphingomonas sp. BK345]